MQGGILAQLNRGGGVRSCSSPARFLEARSLHLTPQFLQCRGRKQGASDVGN